MDKQLWHRLLHRPVRSNKYDYGHVLVIGGSDGMTGAAVLAARAALRVGAGAVTIASAATVTQLIDRDVEEIMTLALPSWSNPRGVVAAVEKFINEHHVSAIIVGPGLPGQADDTIRTLLPVVRLPLVLDAEAFTALQHNLPVLQAAVRTNNSIILTPHAGEYARMTGLVIRDVENSPLAEVRKFVRMYGVTLVLKGPHTLVASGDDMTYENTTGNPGLATAGSGDVLGGIIAGLLAQKFSAHEAATMGVYLHGVAGDMAARSKTEPGMIASDILEALPSALMVQEGGGLGEQPPL